MELCPFLPHFPRIPRYYFDIHNSSNIILDDQGIDLANGADARRLALELLGQTIMEGSAGATLDQVAIEVRDETGPLLRASAAIQITMV